MTENPNALGPEPELTEDQLLAYFHGHPSYAAPVRDALRWALRNDRPFAWYEAKVLGRVLDRLTLDGILDRRDGARYTFRSLAPTVQAIVRYYAERRRALEPVPEGVSDVRLPAGAPPALFSEIIGYESPKRQLLMALNAPEPVHVLLHGPPATAKSLFLEGLATLPGAVYRFGDSIRRAGLRRYLIDEKPPYLIIDEIEKFQEDEDTALLEFMERQRVSMMATGANRDEAVNVRVFAAANYIGRMRPELISRFHRITLKEYTVEEFRMVAQQYLVKKGTPAALAGMIAEGVADRSRDIRDCRRIASMSRTAADAAFLISELGREANV